MLEHVFVIHKGHSNTLIKDLFAPIKVLAIEPVPDFIMVIVKKKHIISCLKQKKNAYRDILNPIN